MRREFDFKFALKPGNPDHVIGHAGNLKNQIQGRPLQGRRNSVLAKFNPSGNIQEILAEEFGGASSKTGQFPGEQLQRHSGCECPEAVTVGFETGRAK